jgi:glutamate/tyrosine decarboxylase-like PLP-dependent enzyme
MRVGPCQESPAASLSLDPATRVELWKSLGEIIEDYLSGIAQRPVSAEVTPEEVRARVKAFDFSKPMGALQALRAAAEGVEHTQVNTPHPRYFGLFNPAPTAMGIAADAVVAALNPQLAAWKHSPFAVEVEHYLIRAFGSRFGYDPAVADGTFTSGGSEANLTALLAALTRAFPQIENGGLRALPGQPVFHVSAEGHHSFQKAARMCGLGVQAVREIPANARLQMDVESLEAAIVEDRRRGFLPFLIVANAGTTNAGIIDPLPEVAAVAAEQELWFHVDAAWGGAAALVPELRPYLDGIERADSITLDAHKWLSAPMGAGILITRHPDILGRTFHISAAYVPPKAEGVGVVDPLEHSIQWSRRSIGLKVFLSLAVAGWDGYAEALRHMTRMGEELRRALESAGWDVVNKTPLPIACFVDRQSPQGRSAAYLESIAREVLASGEAWISTTRVGGDMTVLRACITNYGTELKDLLALVQALEGARKKLAAAASRVG